MWFKKKKKINCLAAVNVLYYQEHLLISPGFDFAVGLVSSTYMARTE